MKRALFASLLGLCLSQPVLAIGWESSPFGRGFSDLSTPRFTPLSLADQERVSFFTALNWQTPVDFLPSFSPVEPASKAVFPARSNERYSLENTPELRTTSRLYVGGEVGFLYGKSGGRYGYEVQEGYIIGEIGNDRFQFTFGTSYGRASGRGRRWSR